MEVDISKEIKYFSIRDGRDVLQIQEIDFSRKLAVKVEVLPESIMKWIPYSSVAEEIHGFLDAICSRGVADESTSPNSEMA